MQLEATGDQREVAESLGCVAQLSARHGVPLLATTPPARGLVERAVVPTQAGLARLLTLLRSSRMGLLVLALAIGPGSGGAAIGFRWLIKAFTLALSGHPDYAGLGHVPNPHVPWLGPWFVIIAP